MSPSHPSISRKHDIAVVFTIAAALAASGSVAAQEADEALVPLPSVLDFTRGAGWGIALGVGLEYEAAYDGSDEYEIEVEPVGALQWRTGGNLFFWEGMEVGWRGLVSANWLLQAGARYEDGLEPDDSDEGYLDGLPERDSHTVGFFEFRRAFGEAWRTWAGARVMGGPSDFGWLGVLAAGHRFGAARDGTGTEVLGFVTFGSADFINKDFGVSAEDSAATGLAETDLDGGYRSVGVSLVHRQDLTDRFQLIAQAGAERYSGDIADSPIARNGYEAEIGLSVVYHF